MLIKYEVQMKRVMIVNLVIVLALAFSFSIFAQDKKLEVKKKMDSTEIKMKSAKEEVGKKIGNTKTQIVDNKPVNTVCLVSGEEIDPEITAVYNGKTYALCCKSCLKKFNKDPEKYVSKLSEDGKSLKKNK